jgi:hypothetical protein
MHILATAFLALIGAFFAAGTAIAGNSSNMQFFPPVAYGTACSQGAPVSAWNGAGSGKGTYCITLPICATGQYLTTIADTNGNPSFACVAIAPDSSLASTTSGSGTTTSSSGTSTSGSSGAGGPSPTGSASTSTSTSVGGEYLESTTIAPSISETDGCNATYLYTDPTTGLGVYDTPTSCNGTLVGTQ